ncbi:MAG TPA: hypothetical protein PKK36_03885 [Kiritimatiellia bacterium]|nr:hypothetical protein [Kiritimatiellia bacterium]HNR93732.1 hypothetical protein [Kiritimatiellia bacterium]HPA78296.1 hypothetical protein [Kiritimatiellia bacterium]HQQ04720.1 hypothetical protein [Kiritimatiellia bacterium]
MQTRFMLMLLVVLAFGCAKKEPAAAPLPEQPPAEVPFTATNEVVMREEIQIADERKAVEADFDMDGLDDLAVIDPREGHQNEVNIFIQKPADEPSAAPAAAAAASGARLVSPEKGKMVYYRAGVIRQPADGTVIGLMIRKRKDITDLLVLLQDETLNNQMLHYFNDGKKFYLDE